MTAHGSAAAPKLSGRAISDAVYADLRDRILSCELEPGTRIVPREVAAAIGVSLAPVGDALQRLSYEGFVRIMPRVGCVITDVRLTDAREIFQLRLELEPFAVRLAIHHATDEELRVFRNTCFEPFEREGGLSSSLASSHVLGRADVHDNFHLQVAELSGNGRLVDMIRGLLFASRRLFALAYRRNLNLLPQSATARPPRHLALAEALAVRDEDSAVRHMAEHVDKGQVDILSILMARRAIADGYEIAP